MSESPDACLQRIEAALVAALAGRPWPSQAREALEDLDAALGACYARHVAELPFREVTPACAEVDEAAALLGELLPALAEAMDGGDPEAVAERIRDVRDQLGRLEAATESLRREDEGRERFSACSPIDGLIRTTRAWLAGRLPPESLELKLREFEGFHRSLVEGLDGLQPTVREREVLDALRPGLHAAVAAQGAALAELRHALEEQREEEVPTLLEAIRSSGEELLAAQRRLAGAEEGAEERPCLHCGSANPATERWCAACRAALPRFAPQADPWSRVDVLDTRPTQARRYERLARLGELVAAVQAGWGDRAELEALLDELDRGLGGMLEEYARMDDRPGATVEAVEASRDALEEGAEHLAWALDLIRQGLDQGTPDLLQRSLEHLEGAGRAMATLEALVAQSRPLEG